MSLTVLSAQNSSQNLDGHVFAPNAATLPTGNFVAKVNLAKMTTSGSRPAFPDPLLVAYSSSINWTRLHGFKLMAEAEPADDPDDLDSILYKTVPAKPNNRPSTVSLRERQFEEQQGENSLANMELPPWQRLQQALFGIAQLEKREDAPTVANEGSTDSEDAEDSFAPKSCLRRSTRHKKNVSFSTVDIHYHKVELGDNPAVSFGPPLARRWEAHGHVRHGLDEYEANTKRRNRKDLLIPGFVRNRLLQQAGYSIYDIEVARSSAEDIRLSRKVNARDGWWNRKRRRRGKYDDDGIVVVNWGQFWGWLLGNREDDDATVASACTR